MPDPFGPRKRVHSWESAWGATRLETPTRLDRDGALEAQLFAIPGKVPGFLHDLVSKDRGACVGVRVTDTRTGSRLVYAPGVRALDPGTRAELEAADCCFVDGTFLLQRCEVQLDLLYQKESG